MYLQVCGGIGNRLRALVSGICWAEDLGRRLIVMWWQDNSCQCSFDKLFDPSGWPSWVEIRAGCLDGEVPVCLQSDEFVAAGYPLAFKSYGHFHSSDPQRWLRYLRALRPVASIQARVDSLPREGLLGIHIRRGDNYKAAEDSPISAYLYEIWKHYQGAGHYVIATDCSEAQFVFLRLFQWRCIFPAHNIHRYSEQGIYEAVVDFFSLARCPVILGSAHSSFTDMAAAYGGAELKIIREKQT